VGKSVEADAAIAGVEAKFAEVRAANPQFAGKKLAFLAAALAQSKVELRSPLEARVQTVMDIGFQLPPQLSALVGSSSNPVTLSPEQFNLLNDVDVLLVTATAKAEMEQFLELPTFKASKIYQEGKYLIVNEELTQGALTWSSVLSIPYALDKLSPLLSRALAGGKVLA
jgi:iron complex transport system substrate-binding protein